MSLRPEVSGSALRGNLLNIVGIASFRGLGTRNDNQSQVTGWLPLLNNIEIYIILLYDGHSLKKDAEKDD